MTFRPLYIRFQLGLIAAKVAGMKTIKDTIDNVNGKIAAPIIMYMLGVPGFLCILAWLFFFKGK